MNGTGWNKYAQFKIEGRVNIVYTKSTQSPRARIYKTNGTEVDK